MWKLTLDYGNTLSFAISLPIAAKSPYLGQPCCYWLSKSTTYTWNLEPFPSKTFILTTIGHLPHHFSSQIRWWKTRDDIKYLIKILMYTCTLLSKFKSRLKSKQQIATINPNWKIYTKHNNLRSDSLKVTITAVITFRELLKCVLPSHSSQIA